MSGNCRTSAVVTDAPLHLLNSHALHNRDIDHLVQEKLGPQRCSQSCNCGSSTVFSQPAPENLHDQLNRDIDHPGANCCEILMVRRTVWTMRISLCATTRMLMTTLMSSFCIMPAKMPSIWAWQQQKVTHRKYQQNQPCTCHCAAKISLHNCPSDPHRPWCQAPQAWRQQKATQRKMSRHPPNQHSTDYCQSRRARPVSRRVIVLLSPYRP